MIKLGLLFGGMSGERDVSLCSAASVYAALDKSKYEVIPIGIDIDGKWHAQTKAEIINIKSFGNILTITKTGRWLVNHFKENEKLHIYNQDTGETIALDFILPIVHGSNCEDGRLQGLLELANVPYAGADLNGSVIAMDKDVARRLLQHGGISVVPWIAVNVLDWKEKPEDIFKMISQDFEYPLFVKPNAAGSSLGVQKVKDSSELRESIENAFLYDNKILIENGIDCYEIECAVLGNLQPEVSITGKIIPKHEFYSYDAKYIDSEGAKLIIPSGLTDELSDSIRKNAIITYKILNCKGMARVDFFLDKESDKFYLNEINTLPGFTSISMYAKLWEQTGLEYSDLIDRLIALGFECHKERNRLKIKPEK